MSSNFESKNVRRWTTILLVALMSLGFYIDDAKAKKRGRRSKTTMDTRALGELMGPFHFGMSKDQILDVVSRQVRERSAASTKTTRDLFEKDRLRQETELAIDKIRASFLRFKGTTSGWDVSIIDDQFAHKNDESMLVHWEHGKDGTEQRRFFFFYKGRLYKMFIVLDSSGFPVGRQGFSYFSKLMTKKYGAGTLIAKTKSTGENYPALIEWKTKPFHVQAIDNTSFYGSYCLMIADPGVEEQVMAARERVRVKPTPNSIIDSVLKDEHEPPASLDANATAVDQAIE